MTEWNVLVAMCVYSVDVPEVSVTSFLPVALATGAATFVGQYFLGPAAAFAVPPLGSISADPQAAILLLLFVMLGAPVFTP